jgi:N-acetylmuramoyl-L-alanine amidase
MTAPDPGRRRALAVLGLGIVAAGAGALVRWRSDNGGTPAATPTGTSTSTATTSIEPVTATTYGTPADTTTEPPSTTLPAPVVVTVIGRRGWGARSPGEGLEPHQVDRVTVHHTAALLEDNADAPDHIRGHQSFHIDTRGWPDLAYHFVIDAGGNVYEGRHPAVRGDTATDYDPTGHLLVCCQGDFDRQPLPDAQRRSLEATLAWGVSTYGLTIDTIAGHGDYASTNCPGAALRDLVADGSLHRAVTDLLRTAGVTLDLVTGEAALDAVAEIERS